MNNVGTNGNYWSSSYNNENNAWNVNFNSGNVNMNNNNRNNGQSVRLVRDLVETPALLSDLFTAYYDARRNKRNTHSQLEFELDLELNIIRLYHELKERTYKPGSCICFIVEDPVKREVFASSFRDRVVHHIYFNYVSPMLERSFIYDSYSCRNGKGTLFGIERLEHHLRSATNNYRDTAWVMKLDLSGYFMSINRKMLCETVKESLSKYWHRKDVDGVRFEEKVDRDFVEWLTEKIVLRNPLDGVRIKGNPRDWVGLPDSKCLSKSPPGVGLPIGDLTSQLFSNVFLNRLDQFVKRDLGFRHYGRYVDDFYIIDESHERLLEARHEIAAFVASMGLRLHPKKVVVQDSWRSLSYLGAVVKPYQRYSTPRTVRNWKRRVEHYRKNGVKYLGDGVADEVRSVMDSYKGYFSHFRAKRMMERMCGDGGDGWFD